MRYGKKLQVFVSSTFTDLRDERQAAVEAILEAGHIPAGMELFAAGDKSQLETIYRWIADSDVYMLILGGRYGTLEPNSKLAYTEVEFNYAISLEKPAFSIVIHEEALEERVRATGSSVIERENTEKLNKFRAKVLGKTSSFFSDVKDIKLGVLKSLREKSEDESLPGWVRAGNIADQVVLEENRKLRIELEAARKNFASVDVNITLPTLPEVSEITQVGIGFDRSEAILQINGSWAEFFPFFLDSVDFSTSDYNGEYYFHVNRGTSRANMAHNLLCDLQGYSTPRAIVSDDDFGRLSAYYIEIGLMRDGVGDKPFEDIGEKLSRRAKITRTDRGKGFQLVKGTLPLNDPDDIPF